MTWRTNVFGPFKTNGPIFLPQRNTGLARLREKGYISIQALINGKHRQGAGAADGYIIEAEHLTYAYDCARGGRRALDDVSLNIKKGEFLAVLGPDGSGKTTLARHFNALLSVQGGTLTVAGMDAGDESCLWELRRRCGMVFQDPYSQFVSSVLWEDAAFAPRNFGVPQQDIPARVNGALDSVGLGGLGASPIESLTAAEKYLAAAAAVLAAQPDIVIFDEPGSTLDTEGRRKLKNVIHRLHQAGNTVIVLSSDVQDAVDADSAAFLRDGRLLAHGEARRLLTDLELIKKAGLTPTLPVRLYHDLKKKGVELPRCPISIEELVDAVCRSQ